MAARRLRSAVLAQPLGQRRDRRTGLRVAQSLRHPVQVGETGRVVHAAQPPVVRLPAGAFVQPSGLEDPAKSPLTDAAYTIPPDSPLTRVIFKINS